MMIIAVMLSFSFIIVVFLNTKKIINIIFIIIILIVASVVLALGQCVEPSTAVWSTYIACNANF